MASISMVSTKHILYNIIHWDNLRILVIFLYLFIFGCPLSALNKLALDFQTIDISNGLSHNMVNAIYKDARGFVWIGTQLGLDRFDGIEVLNYPKLKNYSVYSICETDSIYLWIGTDKGLICMNRKMEVVRNIVLSNNQLKVKTVYPISPKKVLAGTNRGLFIVDDNKVELINLEVDVLSETNNLTCIIEGKKKKTYWITSNDGLIYFDLNTHKSHIYKDKEPVKSHFSCLTLIKDKIYIAKWNVGILAFDLNTKLFTRLAYTGNNYISAIYPASKDDIYIGTNGGGLKKISVATGEILDLIEHIPEGNGISSNAIYSFLKDGDTFWIGTYMGGLNYNPSIKKMFSLYTYEPFFNSKNYNIRSFWLEDDGRKLIGTRDGLIFIDEEKHIFRLFSSKTSIMSSDIILSIFPLNEIEYLIGTYAGGVYKFNSKTMKISYLKEEIFFQKNSFYSFLKDKEDSFWLMSSQGVCVYNPDNNHYTFYNKTNSGLKHVSVFSSLIDSNDRIWLGTQGAVFMYDPKTRVFISDLFPAHILPYTKSVRYIYEDKNKNLWFCDQKEGVVKANQHFTSFEHFTTNDLLPCNSVSSIKEDINGGMWFGTQRGLLFYSENGEKKIYSLYNGIPGYIFNNPVQQTLDGTIWWGNEHGLVYYAPPQKDKTVLKKEYRPAITSILVDGKLLHTGDEIMPFSPTYTSELKLSEGNSLEIIFSSLNYSPKNTDLYEYCLEGYEKGWQMLMTGNKVSYANLPCGKYIFKLRSSSVSSKISSLNIRVEKSMSQTTYIFIIFVIVVLILLLFYSRLLAKYKQIKNSVSNSQEVNIQKEKYSRVRIQEEEVNIIIQKLTNHIQVDKPYLNPDLKLQDVANAIECSSVELSQVLNIHLNTNFTEYINQYRVEDFIIRIQDKSANKYTLSSLSEQSGFSSRTSFFRSFKKIKGTTPAEYIRQIGLRLPK